MPTIKLPSGDLLVYYDSIRQLSAQAYTGFNQAWVRETGLATEGTHINQKLGLLATFINAKNDEGTATAFNNLCEGLDAMEAGENLLAAVLAPCVVSIGRQVFTQHDAETLKETTKAVLASGIGWVDLQEAVALLKKKLSGS